MINLISTGSLSSTGLFSADFIQQLPLVVADPQVSALVIAVGVALVLLSFTWEVVP